jgi:hypothetical protein
LSTSLDVFTYTLTTGSTADVSVRVSCINDQPSFQVMSDVMANQGILTNATEFLQTDFAHSFIYGPNNESTQEVQQFNVTDTSDSLNIINTINILNDGTLQIDFTLNHGVTIIDVSMQNNGGTSDGGINTSDTLTFNITFVDEMFDNGFEDVIVSKSVNYLKVIQSISKDITFDQNGNAILYKNHMFELPADISQNVVRTHIKHWMNEVDRVIE